MSSQDISALCSFCNRTRTSGNFFFSGTTAHICAECVKSSANYLMEKVPTAESQTGNGIAQNQIYYAHELLKSHIPDIAPDNLTTSSRVFPARMRADLQLALEQLMVKGQVKLVGIHADQAYETVKFSDLLVKKREPKQIGPLQYEEVDIGEEQPVRCLYPI